jgi:hypothetical protein
MVRAKEGNSAAFIGTIAEDFALCKEKAYSSSVWMSEDATIYKGDNGYFFRLAKDPRPRPLVKVVWSTIPHHHLHIPYQNERCHYH